MLKENKNGGICMLNPQAKKDLLAIHYDNEDRFYQVLAEFKKDEQGLLIRADKYNLYNKLWFSFCEQVDSYFDTVKMNEGTSHYRNSQRFVDTDLEVRTRMRGLLADTIAQMTQVNQQYAGQDNQPYKKEIMEVMEAILSNDAKTTQQGLADKYGTIKEMCDSCGRSLAYVKRYIESQEKWGFDRHPRDNDMLDNNSKHDEKPFWDALRGVADAKITLSMINKALQVISEDIPPSMRLSHEDQKHLDILKSSVAYRLQQISEYERELHMSLNLTPDGYLYERRHFKDGPKSQIELYQEKVLFDRHLQKKQTEVTMHNAMNIVIPLRNGLKCELSIPIPTPADGKKFTYNHLDPVATQHNRRQWEDNVQKIGEKSEEFAKSLQGMIENAQKAKDKLDGVTAEQILDTMKNLTPEQIGEALNGVEPQTVVDTLNECLRKVKGWSDKIETRIYGQVGDQRIDTKMKWPTTVAILSDNHFLQNAVIARQLRQKQKLEPDWIDDKKNAIKATNKKAKKEVNKHAFKAAAKAVRTVFTKPPLEREAEFMAAGLKFIEDASKEAMKAMNFAMDMNMGGQIPLDLETTLSKQASRTHTLYSQSLTKDELLAEYATHQEGNTRSMRELNMNDDIFVCGYAGDGWVILPKMSTDSMTAHEVSHLPEEHEFHVIFQNGPTGTEVIVQEAEELMQAEGEQPDIAGEEQEQTEDGQDITLPGE